MPDGLMLQLLHDHIRCQDALLLRVLVNGGQAGNGELSQVVIVKAHDGFIPGHAHALFAQARHDARGQDVGGSEDGGDLRFFCEGTAQLFALLHGDFLGKNQRGIKRQAKFRQGLPIPLQALFNDAAGTDRGGSKRDLLVALFQQMPGGDIAAFFVLQADAAHAGIIHIAVDQHEGHAQILGGVKKRVLEHAGHDQPGQPPAAAEGVQLGGGFHRAHHQIVSILPGALFDAVHKSAQKWIAHSAACVLRGQMGDHADDEGMVVGQGTGGHAGHVMLPLDDFPYFFHPVRRNPAFSIVHHVGYRGDADARFGGDVFQSDHVYLHVFLLDQQEMIPHDR